MVISSVVSGLWRDRTYQWKHTRLKVLTLCVGGVLGGEQKAERELVHAGRQCPHSGKVFPFSSSGTILIDTH